MTWRTIEQESILITNDPSHLNKSILMEIKLFDMTLKLEKKREMPNNNKNK